MPSADLSQTPAILDAIYDLATTASGVTFKAGKKWAAPQPDEVKGNLPYFVVMAPVTIGGYNGRQIVGGQLPRMSGVSYPAHDYLCYALFPHRDPTNPTTYSTPEWAKTLLMQLFTITPHIGDTGMLLDLRDCTVIPELEITKHTQPYAAVRLVLRVVEKLNVDYS